MKSSRVERLELISSRIRSSSLVLDIGSKDNKLKQFIPKNVTYYSIDKKPIKKNTIRGDAENLPFKTGIFDYVVVSEVLEHLSNPGLCLKEVRRVMKNNASVLITVPNANNFYFFIMAIFRKLIGDPDHVSLHTPKTIVTLLKRYDFKINELFTVYFKKPKINNNSYILECIFPMLCQNIFVRCKQS